MVTDALLTVLNGLLAWGRGLLPNWSMSMPTGLVDFLKSLFAFDAVLPVSEVCVVSGLLLSFIVAVNSVKWTVKLIDWIAAVIP